MTSSGLPEDLLREAGRVADRLRVLGPRWAARDVAGDAAEVARVRAALAALASAASAADGVPRPAVPELALRALADQVLVLAHDCAAAGAGGPAHELLTGLRRALP